jgi:hypothetical protein
MPNEPVRDPVPERAMSEGRGLSLQWIGLLFAPAVFFVHLQVAYVMVRWACIRDGAIWIHVLGAFSVVLAAAGMWAAWRVWSEAGGDAPGEGGGAQPRARFLGVCGLLTSAMFVLLLAAQWVAAFFISPCQ